MCLNLHVKPFSFQLIQALKTSTGIIEGKRGWLLRLENSAGTCGWGEVSPLTLSELGICEQLLQNLGSSPSREGLEAGMASWPGSLAFGIGAALGEIDGLISLEKNGGWLPAPPSAILLRDNQSLLKEIDFLLTRQQTTQHPLTFKWKIALESQEKEKALLVQILELLPANARLRLDANAALDRLQAQEWATHLLQEPRLEWLEQPLPADDLEGLTELAKQIPVALDESLLTNPNLKNSWKSWQIRRPLLEGDPRLLLKELEDGVGYRILSTTFETGIGLRWLHHLAALQQKGPTPTAPGLAPGWCPNSPLFSTDPTVAWEAA